MTDITLQRGVAIAVTFALLVVVFELVRRKRLSERYAILWLLAAITLFVLAVWKGLLTSLSHDVGISYPPSALFAVAIGLIAIILLHFSLAVSRLSDQNKVLAQRLGLLQQRIEHAEQGTIARADDTDEPRPPEAPDVPGEGRGRQEPVVEQLSGRR
ncbi:MAG TPA: DUF2304 domain-containing protein [Solirubrobacteraceae bacterium]|nr:DUF2304 domain-containing protein [Solirubrobacteraceae bacterium]